LTDCEYTDGVVPKSGFSKKENKNDLEQCELTIISAEKYGELNLGKRKSYKAESKKMNMDLVKICRDYDSENDDNYEPTDDESSCAPSDDESHKTSISPDLKNKTDSDADSEDERAEAKIEESRKHQRETKVYTPEVFPPSDDDDDKVSEEEESDSDSDIVEVDEDAEVQVNEKEDGAEDDSDDE
jgi:hypothetical protein